MLISVPRHLGLEPLWQAHKLRNFPIYMLERENYSENMMGFVGRMGVRTNMEIWQIRKMIGKERIIS